MGTPLHHRIEPFSITSMAVVALPRDHQTLQTPL
jgi:hypothetical protein